MYRYSVRFDRLPAMSLDGADETPEFASRITYEAREDLAKDGASRLQRAISTDNDDDGDGEDDGHRASCTCRVYVA